MEIDDLRNQTERGSIPDFYVTSHSSVAVERQQVALRRKATCGSQPSPEVIHRRTFRVEQGRF